MAETISERRARQAEDERRRAEAEARAKAAADTLGGLSGGAAQKEMGRKKQIDDAVREAGG